MKGIFETIRYRDRKLEFFREHLERLKRGCEAEGFLWRRDDVESMIFDRVAKLGLQDDLCRIRIILTAEGILISAEVYQPLPKELYHKGMALDLQPHPSPSADAQMKRIDRAGYTEAFERAKEKGFDECLFHHQGELLECSSANIIVVDGGRVMIPPRSAHRLTGVTEQKLLERLGSTVLETHLYWPLPPQAQIYLTSSLRGLLPVQRIADQAFDVDPADPLYQLIPQFWPY